jgi:hypothetical protein
MDAKLIRESWLFREWEVDANHKLFRIAYDGRGFGFESIQKDGIAILRTPSYLWFVPRFEFEVDGLPFSVDVRVWPWLQIRAIRLAISGKAVYSEGFSNT